MMTPGKYFVGFAATFVVSAVLIGVFNYVIDPYFIYDTARIPYLNIEKPRSGSRRIFMPIYITRQHSDVIVLGSSRGTATSKAFAATWPQEKIQDAGVSALRVREAIEYLTLFASRSDIKTIVYQPDFFSFNRNFPYHPTFVPTIVGEGNLWRLQVIAIFGLTTLKASVETVYANLRSGRAARNPFEGLEVNSAPKDNVEQMREWFKYQLDTYTRSPEFYKNFELDTESLHALAVTFRKITASGKKLIVLIGPSHALQWEDKWRAGLWPQLETWKRGMVALAANTGIPIWDFSSFSPISTLHADKSALPWYADSSHFTQKTAQLAVNCLLFGESCAQLDGAQLRSESIDSRLRSIREKRLQWLAQPGIESDLSLLPPPPADAVHSSKRN